MRLLFIFLAALLVAPLAAAQSASSSGSLSSRIQSGDMIQVSTTDNRELEGKCAGVSDEELTLLVRGQPLVIAAGDVREVRRRGSRLIHRGMLIGFIGGATVATVAGLSSHTDSPGAQVFIGVIAGGGAGLIWGAVIGSFFHEYPVVYQKPELTVHWLPVLTPHRIGLIANIHF